MQVEKGRTVPKKKNKNKDEDENENQNEKAVPPWMPEIGEVVA